jgi:propionyl-CoA carboxylase alpha chain
MTIYQVTLGERVFRVSIRQSDATTFVRVDDGDEQSIRLEPVNGRLYSLARDDRRIELLASVNADTVSMAIAGLEYRAEVVDEARARLASVAGARAASHTHLELKAPMPGLLVRVLCEPGDTIEPGQPLAVLQAMKMENELSLPRRGTVSAVNAQPGQTVEQGQVLLMVE